MVGYAKDADDYRVEDIFLDVTSEYDLPTDDFGHNCPNTVLPVGGRVRLDADTATLELIEPCVR